MSEPVHTEHEDDAWTISIPDHPRRSDSPEYVASRAQMNKIAREAAASPDGLLYSGPPWQDHHGGGCWLKDAGGWFIVKNTAGMEWSSQFAADPAKVDQIRRNAQRLYAMFPGVADELGVTDLLATPITDAAGVAKWTDSICNASVPLSPVAHTGELPKGGGVHHYPTPITDIQFFKYDDFNLWVTDEDGHEVAVAPMAPRGSGDTRVHVIHASPLSRHHAEHRRRADRGEAYVLSGDHPLAQQAFAQQAQPEGNAA